MSFQAFVRSIAGDVDFTLCARMLRGVTVLARSATVSGLVLGGILSRAKHSKATHKFNGKRNNTIATVI